MGGYPDRSRRSAPFIPIRTFQLGSSPDAIKKIEKCLDCGAAGAGAAWPTPVFFAAVPGAGACVAGLAGVCPVAGTVVVIASTHKQQNPAIFLRGRVFLCGGIFFSGMVVSGRAHDELQQMPLANARTGAKRKFDSVFLAGKEKKQTKARRSVCGVLRRKQSMTAT